MWLQPSVTQLNNIHIKKVSFKNRFINFGQKNLNPDE